MKILIGSKGKTVSLLNQLLCVLGYRANAKNDDFDEITQSAVEAFQNDYNFKITGIVDDKTWDKLVQSDACNNYITSMGISINGAIITNNEHNNNAETNVFDENFNYRNSFACDDFTRSGEIVYSKDATYPTLKQGDSGEYVIILKNILTENGYLLDTENNDFDLETANAVKSFQKENALTIDGVVNQTVWDMLNKKALAKSTTYPTLRQGSKGEYVTILQTKLREKGLFNGTIDGNFGPATRTAVIAFQRANNLSADGIVGKSTWSSILNVQGGGGGGGGGSGVGSHLPTIRQGSRGQYVVLLQTKLKEKGFLTGIIDGNFGPATRIALIAFQRDNKLSADGIAGLKTWIELLKIGNETENYPTIRRGDSGNYVKKLQQMLNALGYDVGAADGRFGAKTAEMVMLFQRDLSLTADGVVGKGTWTALLNAYNLISDEATLSPTDMRTLKEGDTGDHVTILQEKLRFLGFYKGTVTGSFAPDTKVAVIAFQTAMDLTADGIVGLQTWIVLFRETQANYPGLPSNEKPTISPGDTGVWVEYLQNELKTLMYYNGAITGIFDSITTIALKSFQDTNRLTPDGVVGKNTWNALNTLYPPPVIC